MSKRLETETSTQTSELRMGIIYTIKNRNGEILAEVLYSGKKQSRKVRDGERLNSRVFIGKINGHSDYITLFDHEIEYHSGTELTVNVKNFRGHRLSLEETGYIEERLKRARLDTL